MSHQEQVQIDLREPVDGWQKWLSTVVSALLLAFLTACCRWHPQGTNEFATKLIVVLVVSLPAMACCVTTLFLWWGKKYLLIKGEALGIHWELLGLKRTRYVQVGHRSQLVLRTVTRIDPADGDPGGTCSTQLELTLSEAYGNSCRLLAFAVSEQERAEAICREICRHLPALKFEQHL